LEQSFIACMPLLMATNAFGLQIQKQTMTYIALLYKNSPEALKELRK